MDIFSAVILAFGLLEALNVVILYFAPGFTQGGNSVAVFDAWEKTKKDPEVHAFVSYLVNWVAGTKLIFVALLAVIVVWGNPATRFAAVVALILSIATFYWRLYPILRRMDKAGWLTPAGYSRTLGWMIAGFLAVFVAAIAAHFLWGQARPQTGKAVPTDRVAWSHAAQIQGRPSLF